MEARLTATLFSILCDGLTIGNTINIVPSLELANERFGVRADESAKLIIVSPAVYRGCLTEKDTADMELLLKSVRVTSDREILVRLNALPYMTRIESLSRGSQTYIEVIEQIQVRKEFANG